MGYRDGYAADPGFAVALIIENEEAHAGKTSWTTASITPPANTLLLLSISTGNTTGANAGPSSVTGNGLTWTLIASKQQSTGNQRVSVYRAFGASPTTGVITITYAANQQNTAHRLISFVGADLTGDPIAQSATGDGTSPGNASVALSTVTAGNGTFGALVQNSTSSAVTAGTGFTEIGNADNTNPGSPSTRLVNEWSDTGTAPVVYNTGSVQWAMVALEIKVAPVLALLSPPLIFVDGSPAVRVAGKFYTKA